MLYFRMSVAVKVLHGWEASVEEDEDIREQLLGRAV